jgi:hypothetical protein
MKLESVSNQEAKSGEHSRRSWRLPSRASLVCAIAIVLSGCEGDGEGGAAEHSHQGVGADLGDGTHDHAALDHDHGEAPAGSAAGKSAHTHNGVTINHDHDAPSSVHDSHAVTDADHDHNGRAPGDLPPFEAWPSGP